MVIYTKSNCPLCNVVKLKLKVTGYDFTECTDETTMDKLNIDQLPVLQLDDGTMLNFSQALDFIKGDKK